MVSEKMIRRIIQEGIFGNCRMNYFGEFDLLTDILFSVNMFCVKKFLWEDSEKGDAQGGITNHIHILLVVQPENYKMVWFGFMAYQQL